jgi:hypothetical protein
VTKIAWGKKWPFGSRPILNMETIVFWGKFIFVEMQINLS